MSLSPTLHPTSSSASSNTEAVQDWSSLQIIQNQLRKGFNGGRLRTLNDRLDALKRIENLVQENENLFCQAIQEDMGRPVDDSIFAELSILLEEVRAAQKNLHRWMKPIKKRLPLALLPGLGSVTTEPFGVVLIIGPWNYPFQLLLAPLISAIAAGNCALLKPSELTPRCSRVLAEVLPKYLSSDIAQIVEGGVGVSEKLLELKWDFIFFTGSTQVGRVVAQAAARHLTPTVLELGGKSPCIVDETADLSVSARRILWGKVLNSGQTCVAPDYIFTPRSNAENLCRALEKALTEFFPEGFIRNETYCGIVNQRHFQRLEALAEAHKIQLRIGGKVNASQLLIEPSFYVLDRVDLEHAPIMKEEIFGPLTPIITYDTIDDVISYINANELPLALYVFSKNKEFLSLVEKNTRSGAFVANDTVVHLAASELPLGGIGGSGVGSYHGHFGFNALSHHRAVLKRPFWLDLPIRYRPYKTWKLWLLLKILRYKRSKIT